MEKGLSNMHNAIFMLGVSFPISLRVGRGGQQD